MARDYYEVLGVKRDASDKDIKSAYRRLARQHHPDVNRDDPQAERRFKEIQEAYGVLGDADKRRQYDQFGHRFEQFGNGGAGGFGSQGFQFSSDGVDLSDIGGVFGDLFGGRGRDRFGGWFGAEQRGWRGNDAEVDLQVTLEEVARGAIRDVSFQVEEICDRCGGSGRERGGRCGGCHGTGHVRRTRTVKGLKIPAGVEDDKVLRVTGRGGPGGGGGANGDLLLRVQVQPHPFYTRQGEDLVCELPVTLAEAAMGAEVPVPTLDGIKPLRIPPGTHGGQ